MVDMQIINERREEILREVEANRLARRLRASRRREPLAFAREMKLDFIRLADVFRRSAKSGKRKGRV